MLVKIEQESGVKSIKIAEASDGLNAYQLAVKNDGFVGDYDAWKVTLKGDEGKSAFEVWEVSNPGGTLEQYNAFIKGEAGYTPIKGTDYFDGAPFVYEDLTQTQKDELKIATSGEVVSGNLNAVSGEKVYLNNQIQPLYDIQRGVVSIVGNTITIGVGIYYFIDKTNIQVFKDVTAQEVYTLAHNESLSFNKTTLNFEKKAKSLLSFDKDIMLLNYDSVGGLGGGLWYKYILKNNIKSNTDLIAQAKDYQALTAMSRASISISGNILTLGDGYIYIIFKDGTQKAPLHVSASYTFSNGQVLVYNRKSNLISKKSGTTILEDDAILFNYDSLSGGFLSGLLINKVLDDKIKSTDPTINLLTSTVKGIAHRGYSTVAPENILPAFKLAKEKGFAYVETDVQFSSDNVPVILHDSTVDRTSNGTGNVNSLTLTELKALDFGGWKSAEYTGATIPTFEEFLWYCKRLNLHPYVEPKNPLTSGTRTTLIDIAIKTGMINRMTWISFDLSSLSLILTSHPSARVGYVTSTLNSTVISDAISLKTSINEVFVDANSTTITQLLVEEALIGGIEVESWTVDSGATVLSLVGLGVSGITTNILNIEDVLNA